MVEEENEAGDQIGLCLSGGGFRASLFHLGSLWRLNELGLLQRMERISSVSGGSITAGVLALSWRQLEQQGWSSEVFKRLVADKVRKFCELDVDVWAIGEGALLPWRTAGDVIRQAYDKHLFANATLQDLPDKPVFVINATNLQTGRLVRITKRYVSDWTVGEVRNPATPLSTVIAASSAFPPFLSPVVLDTGEAFQKLEGSMHHDDPTYNRKLHLTDGGVYDNLGLEPVWKRCRTILVCDAGAPFALGAQVETDWVKQTLRALDIATDQARALRKRWLVDQFQREVRRGAYWGIDTDIMDYPRIDALPSDPTRTGRLAGIRTRLNRFSEQEQGELINLGYALCDAAIRSRAAWLVPEATRPESWPNPDQALGRIR